MDYFGLVKVFWLNMKTANPNQIFKSLVDNGIDFLERSVAELEERPKYAVINFCSAIELFLKARLMLEHWALLITKPEKADLDDFNGGNFQSIQIEEAMRRLRSISKQDFSKEEIACFNQIREHRNKLVHFFHPRYVSKPDDATITEVVVEQFRGWYYLHKLLTKKWRKEFDEFSGRISQINRLMLQKREYLKAKFEALKLQIREEQKQGIRFESCFFCEYESSREKEIVGELVSADCLVCEQNTTYLKVVCPDCCGNVSIYELGQGTCKKCGREIDLDYLVETYGGKKCPKDEMIDPSRAYCDECAFVEFPTVVLFNDKGWLCLSCLTLHEKVGECRYCNSFVAGDLEYSYLSGCVMCEGKIGDLGDD